MKKFVFLSLSLLAICAMAQLSPGELANVHKAYEGVENCNKCHSMELGVDPQKCLDCHKLLAKEILEGKGLHANSDFKKCQQCHVDHLGESNELIWWKDGSNNFNHDLSGYKLNGAHKKLKCRDCHKKENIKDKQPLLKQEKKLDRTFLGLTKACLNCHVDAHNGQISTDCISCHTFEFWKPAKNFNHDRAAFKLTGAHAKVECINCHVPDINKKNENRSKFKFNGFKFERCSDCHKDPHENRFGPECVRCHRTSSWKDQKSDVFNHDLTDYQLTGLHTKIKCKNCHKPGRPMKPLAHGQCIDCHLDYHQGQIRVNGKVQNCDFCHSTQGFYPSIFSIENHQKTKFQLVGAHLAVPCNLCHTRNSLDSEKSTTPIFLFSKTDCGSCHENVHGENINRFTNQDGCKTCHSEMSWNDQHFDHGQTKFPLTGNHEFISCINCHPNEKEGDKNQLLFKKTDTECNHCHEDYHRGQFVFGDEKTCDKCHVTKDWFAENFNHNRDATFKLKGKHKSVECASCHKPAIISGKKITRYKPLASNCKSCHDFKDNKNG